MKVLIDQDLNVQVLLDKANFLNNSVVGTEAKVEETEANVEGTEVNAEGTDANTEGTEANAEDTKVNAEDTEVNAEDTKANAEGAEANVEGTEANAEGNEANAGGNEVLVDGMEGGGFPGGSLIEGDMGGAKTKDPLLSNWVFVIGITAVSLVVSIGLGILLAKRKIKKGIELYEN